MDRDAGLSEDERRRYELAIEELEQANRRLARDWLGRSDAAAAAVLGRLSKRVEDAEARAAAADLNAAQHEQRAQSVLTRVDELTRECLAIGDERGAAQQEAVELRRILARRPVRVAIRLTAVANALLGRGRDGGTGAP